jgi:hypothetical protein
VGRQGGGDTATVIKSYLQRSFYNTVNARFLISSTDVDSKTAKAINIIHKHVQYKQELLEVKINQQKFSETKT